MTQTLPPCPSCGPAFLAWLQRDAALSERWQTLPRRTLRRQQVLVEQGQPLQALWWVEQGLLRASVVDAEGRERNQGFFPELQWLGLPGGLPASPWQLQALEPSRLVELDAQALQRLQQDWPEASALLMQGLSLGLAHQTAREQQLLLQDAASRYQQFLAEHAALAARLSLRQIAAYLGITDVALSRIRRRLRER